MYRVDTVDWTIVGLTLANAVSVARRFGHALVYREDSHRYLVLIHPSTMSKQEAHMALLKPYYHHEDYE